MPPRWVIAARTLVFIAVFGFINFTPFYKQVLRSKAAWARDWVMFSGFGLAVCDVKFSQALPGGETMPIDRFELLGYEDHADAPLWLRRIPNKDGVRRVARKVCRALGEGADVRLSARCASARGTGWNRVDRGDTNVCESRK